MKFAVNITVVDDGGHLQAFARMDEARPASGYTALTTAVTATVRQATGPLPASWPHPHQTLANQSGFESPAAGYTSRTGTGADQPHSATPPDLLQLLAQLADLPADQRAALVRLLAPPPAADPPVGPALDDTPPPALERTVAPREGRA